MNDTVEKMRRHIVRTGIDEKTRDRYGMVLSEIKALIEVCRSRGADGEFDALCLAFDYGVSKGFRAAKAKKEATV